MLVLGLVIAANVGSRLHLNFGSGSTPAGVSRVVDDYYNAVQRGDPAAALKLICPARQRAWSAGQRTAAGDLRRGVTGHTIGAADKAGAGYVVHVTLNLRAGAGRGSTAPSIHVARQNGGFAVCGGTSP